ncbi:MAG TPA: cytochrome c oxidase assembly protein [Candidatus Binatia bacterium]
MKKFLLTVGALLLILSPLYLLKRAPRATVPEPVLILSRYLKASYARDYKQAYRFISGKDRQLKPEKVYVRERGAFSGFTLAVARRLAELIAIEPVKITPAGDRTRIKAALKLPDAGSLAPLLLDWDEEKLNALSAADQRKILAAIDRQRRSGTIKMIEGEEEFALVKEDKAWRMALDWDAALRVSFAALVPANGAIEAEPVSRETVVKSSEPFRISYRVSNRSDKNLRTRITHKVEPEELREHLDIIECALLLPTSVPAGQQREYSTTYLVRGDLPESARKFNITYEFKIDP